MYLDELIRDAILKIFSTADVGSLEALSLTSREINIIADSDIVWENKFMDDFPEASSALNAEIGASKITKAAYIDYLQYKLKNQAQEIMRLGMLLTNNEGYISKIDSIIPIHYLFYRAYPPHEADSSSFHEKFKTIMDEEFDDIAVSFKELINVSRSEVNSISLAYQLYLDREKILDGINNKIFSTIINHTLKIINDEIRDPRAGTQVIRNGQIVPLRLSKRLQAMGLITRLTESSIDELFLKIPDIEELHLDCSGLTSIPKNIDLLFGLKKLYLQHNNLTFLPDKLPSLKKLNLISNKFTIFPYPLLQVSSLKSLEIGNFAPSGTTCICCDSLGKRTTGNKFSSSSLPQLNQLTNLKYLCLRSLELDDLPKEIAGMMSLKRVILRHNNISNLPKEFGARDDLQLLLEFNSIVYNPFSDQFDLLAAYNNSSYNLTQRTVSLLFRREIGMGEMLESLTEFRTDPMRALRVNQVNIIAIAIVANFISLSEGVSIQVSIRGLLFLMGMFYFAGNGFSTNGEIQRVGMFSGSRVRAIEEIAQEHDAQERMEPAQ